MSAHLSDRTVLIQDRQYLFWPLTLSVVPLSVKSQSESPKNTTSLSQPPIHLCRLHPTTQTHNVSPITDSWSPLLPILCTYARCTQCVMFTLRTFVLALFISLCTYHHEFIWLPWTYLTTSPAHLITYTFLVRAQKSPESAWINVQKVQFVFQKMAYNKCLCKKFASTCKCYDNVYYLLQYEKKKVNMHTKRPISRSLLTGYKSHDLTFIVYLIFGHSYLISYYWPKLVNE